MSWNFFLIQEVQKLTTRTQKLVGLTIRTVLLDELNINMTAFFWSNVD